MVLMPLPFFLFVAVYLGSGVAVPELDEHVLSDVETKDVGDDKLTNESIHRRNVSLDHPIVHQFVSDRPSEISPRRLQLYPQWFAKRIPQLLGKSFARRYFYPFGKSHSPAGRTRIEKATDKDGVRRELLALSKSLSKDESEFHVPGISKQVAYLPLSQILTSYPSSMERIDAPTMDSVPELTMPVAEPTHSYVGDPMDFQVLPQYSVPSYLQPVQPSVLQYPFAEALGNGEKLGEEWLSYVKTGHALAHHHPCHHNPCLNAGHCHVQKHDHGKFGCKCKMGFSGRYCQVVQASCHPNPCFHGGTCTKVEHGYFCSCESDYKGSNCQLEAVCFKNPCQNGGICTELEDGYYCTCTKEFTGKDCAERVSPCMSNPCKNSGTCIAKDETFSCKCNVGYVCDDCSCQVAINQTVSTSVSTVQSSHPKPCPFGYCKNGGTCFSTKDGPICTCPLAFKGVDCSAPNLCNPSPCDNGGICLQDGEENYKCICPYGFKGPNCEDQLSCMSHPCLNGGKCHETPTSFRCDCAQGFKGISCDQLSPCSKSPCEHSLACNEKGPLFACQCAEGYRGKSCQERDPCAPNPCANGVCHEIEGIRACNCSVGWMGDFCEIKDECHPNKCQNGGTCVHNGGHFHCICAEGFYGNHCQYPSPCLSNPCGGNGDCHITDYGYICICREGFRGKLCDVRNKCHPSPCLNGGFCFEGDDDFICECQAGYTGRTCHIQDFCDPNPCRNGGSCFEKIGSFSCSCLSGYVGEKCEADVCLPNPCKNSGTCVPSNTPHGYACECLFPFHGHNCLDSDPCQPNPCKNGGTCKNHLLGFSQESLLNQEIHNDGEHVITIVQSEGAEAAGIHSHDQQEDDTTDSHDITSKETHLPLHVIVHGDYHPDSAPVAVHDGDETDHNAWVSEVEHFSASHNVHHVHNVPDWYYNNDPKSQNEEDSVHLSTRAKISRKPRNENKRSGGLKMHRLSKKSRQRFRERKEERLGKRSGVARASKKDSVLRPRQLLTTEQLVKRNQLAKRTLQDLYVCHCPAGFLGAHCQHPNYCQSSPCQNGGTCMPRGNRYQCRCPIGFGGLNCDDYKPCEPNPCLNGGKCLLSHTVRGYYCECPRGFTGYVCEDVDHCVRKNPCLHNSKCTSTKQGVECKCRQRYTGPHCGVDKCRECSVNATCHRGHCVCNTGFIGNGFRCQAIGDPCSPNPCENGGLCFIGEDGNIFDCSCRAGFKGSRCEFFNPCSSTPCQHSGVCVDSSNSKEKGIILIDHRDYKCFCPQGYRGRNCEETTLGACSSAPCQNKAVCFDVSDENYGRKKFLHPDEYDCFCQRGYSGKNCEIHGFACHVHPCQNGGTCLDEEMLPDVSFDSHGYKCYCRQGFFGRNCEVNIGSGLPCHSSPCFNQGRCIDIGNNEDPDLIFQDSTEFKCFCPAHFSGEKCEFTFPACAMNPCRHNGTCIDGTTHPDMNFDETGYHCLCGTGYEGKNCERQYAFASLEEEKMLRTGEATDNDEEGQIPLYIADSSSIGDGTAEALSDDVHHDLLKSSPWSVYKEGKAGHQIISLTKDSNEGHTIATVYKEKVKTSLSKTGKPEMHVISLSTDDGKPGGAGQVLEEATKIKSGPVVTEEETVRPIYIFSVNNGKITDPGHKVAEVANKGDGVSTIVHVKPDSGIPGGAATIVDQVAKSLTLSKEGSQQVFAVYPDSKVSKGNGQIVVIEKTLTNSRPTTTKTTPTTKPKITPDLASLAAAKQPNPIKISPTQTTTKATTTPPPTSTTTTTNPPTVKIDQAVMEYNEAAKQATQQGTIAAQNSLAQVQAPPSNLIPASLLTPQAISSLQGAVLNSLSGQSVPMPAASLPLQNPAPKAYNTNAQPQQPAYPASYIPAKPAARISIPNAISTNQFGRYIGVPAIQPRFYYISPFSAKKSKLPK